MRLDADIVYCTNNGTMAIEPTETGRLASLVMKTKKGHERSWVFGDSEPWIDSKTGDEYFDHIRRGVMAGTWAQGHEFLELCRELGLTTQSSGLFVPFSNGQPRFGTFRDGGPFADYSEEELVLARVDLPTREMLETLLGTQSRIAR